MGVVPNPEDGKGVINYKGDPRIEFWVTYPNPYPNTGSPKDQRCSRDHWIRSHQLVIAKPSYCYTSVLGQRQLWPVKWTCNLSSILKVTDRIIFYPLLFSVGMLLMLSVSMSSMPASRFGRQWQTLPEPVSSTSRSPTSGWLLLQNRMSMLLWCSSFSIRWWKLCSPTLAKSRRIMSRTTLSWFMKFLMVSMFSEFGTQTLRILIAIVLDV